MATVKPFLIWMAVTLAAFGALAGTYHLSLEGDPRRILVVVDSSFPMTSAWHRVPSVLDRLDDQRYAAFGLITEKSPVHGWQPQLALGRLSPYAPRDFARLRSTQGAPEAEQATEVFFLTNASEDQLEGLPSWTIIRP